VKTRFSYFNFSFSLSEETHESLFDMRPSIEQKNGNKLFYNPIAKGIAASTGP